MDNAGQRSMIEGVAPPRVVGEAARTVTACTAPDAATRQTFRPQR